MEARACRRRIVAGMLAGVVLAACGSGSSTGSVPTDAASTEVTTSAPPDTTTPSSTTEASTTTSVAPADGHFVPACVEQDASGVVPQDDPALDTFGPLGAEPVVQMQLPRIPVDASVFRTLDIPRVDVHRIAGGLLVSMRPWDGIEDFGQIVAIDPTGAVRWQRCPDASPMLRTAGSGHATEALLGWYRTQPDGTMSTNLTVWSLADGRQSRTWEDLLAAAHLPTDERIDMPIAEGRDLMVMARPGPGATPTGPLILLDLRTMTPTSVGDPRAAVPTLPADVQLGFTPDDVLVAFTPSYETTARVGAVWAGGAWSADPEVISAAVPTKVDFHYDETGETLVAYRPDGSLRWHRDDVYVTPGEGFRLAVDGGVAIARTCSGPLQADGQSCPGAALQAFDVATGRTLWQRTGSWTVATEADGRALIAGPFDLDATTWLPPVWRMVDMATGDEVGDRTWTDPWDFSIGCCDSPRLLVRSGGVVIGGAGESVELWYPDAASTPMARVELG